MVELKELVSMQQFNGKTDFEIIRDWFIDNEAEGEGINLMNILAKNKIDKQALQLRKIKGNLSMYAGDSTLFKKFGNEIGGRLNHIIHLFLADYDIEKDYPQHFEWLKKNIPTLKCPDIFWSDFYNYLKSKQIYFLGENKNDK